MRCIAHRGFAGANPENTIPAIRAAVAAGADAVEVDVRRCASGELVACHDPTVDRVTDTTGSISDLSLEELSAVNVKGSDAGIPAVSAILADLPAEVDLVAELKEAGLGHQLTTLMENVANRVLVSSFEPERFIGVDRPRVLLCGGPTVAPTTDQLGAALQTATENGCVGIHLHWQWCSPTVVEWVHDADLFIAAWTVRTPADLAWVQGTGVDGVISDVPGLCPE